MAMYDADDGEYAAYEEDEHRPNKRRKRFIGIAFITYAAVGVALAQTITLNGSNRVEFGQGIVTLKACDSFITISLTPSSAIFSGLRANGTSYTNESRVKNIKMLGLDTQDCAGKKIKIQLFDSVHSSAMNLFQDANSVTSDRALLAADLDKSVSRADALTVVNAIGQNIGYYDNYQYLDFDPNTATYTLIFTTPLALMSDVTRLTVETSNN